MAKDLSKLWTREYDEDGVLHHKAWYVTAETSAVYDIKRMLYGQTVWYYQLFVSGQRVPLAFSRRLKDVKAHAQEIEDKNG